MSTVLPTPWTFLFKMWQKGVNYCASVCSSFSCWFSSSGFHRRDWISLKVCARMSPCQTMGLLCLHHWGLFIQCNGLFTTLPLTASWRTTRPSYPRLKSSNKAMLNMLLKGKAYWHIWRPSIPSYFSLKLAYLIFSAAEQFSTNLQAKDTTVKEGTRGAHLLRAHYTSLRNETAIITFYWNTVESTSGLTDEPALPCYRKAPRVCSKVSTSTITVQTIENNWSCSLTIVRAIKKLNSYIYVW